MNTTLEWQAGVGQQCFYLPQTDEPQVVLQAYIFLGCRCLDDSLKVAKSFKCLLSNARGNWAESQSMLFWHRLIVFKASRCDEIFRYIGKALQAMRRAELIAKPLVGKLMLRHRGFQPPQADWVDNQVGVRIHLGDLFSMWFVPTGRLETVSRQFQVCANETVDNMTQRLHFGQAIGTCYTGNPKRECRQLTVTSPAGTTSHPSSSTCS